MSVRKFSTASILSPSYKDSKIWDGTTFPGYFESIQTVVISTSGTTLVEFTNIPQNYKHLQVRAVGRVGYPGTSSVSSPQYRFNDDSGSNYSNHRVGTFGTGTFSDGEANQSIAGGVGWMSAATAGAGIFGAFVMDILDYSNTSKYKTVKTQPGVSFSGGGWSAITSNGWRSTSAITKISFIENNNYGWNQYSQFALYGIRTA